MKSHFFKIFFSFALGLVLSGALFGVFVVSYPALAQSGSVDLGLSYGAKTGLASADIRLVIASVIRAALGFLGVVAVVIILYAGFRWMTAGGNAEQVATSKRILINAVIGLMIILTAFSITNYIITQLNNAINGGGGNPGGGNPGGGGLPSSILYVSSLPSSGQACIRNVHPTIVFNQDVDLATVTGNIVINNQAGQAVAGSWAYLNNVHTTISFTPSGSCAPDPGNDCLLPQTNYTLVFSNPGAVKTPDGSLTLNCLVRAGCGPVSFTTGAGVDRLPPTITITSPLPADPLSAGATIPVTMHFNDDNGVAQVSLAQGGVTIGGQSFANCQKTGDLTINWQTQNLTPGAYTLNATAIDFSAQTGNAATTVNLKPSTCFNGIQDNGETAVDCGGVCGACGGSSCGRNADCASGYCQIPNGQTVGVCVNKMSIQAFTPNSGAPSTIVSVDGFFFGTTPGHVYFAAVPNPDPAIIGNWVEAHLAPCGDPLKSWTNYEILAEVPAGAVTGPIMVVTAPTLVNGVQQTFTDVTNDVAWGPVLNNFQVTNQIRPGLCSATPSVGNAGDAVALTGKNFGLLDNGQDAVFFADQKAAVSPQNWNDSFITTAVPNSAPFGQIAIKVVNNGVESNGVRFGVLDGANAALPVVSGVSPIQGGAGEYLTITGSNFGSLQGKVWFKLNGQGVASVGEVNFPQACQSNLWSETTALVKVPSSLKGAVGDYTIQIVRGGTNQLVSVINNASHFQVVNSDPTPGICAISPASGAVPFPTGQVVKISGEYFGANPSVYFWRTGATNNAITGRTQADPLDNFTVQNTSITARPPANTETGPVIVYRSEDRLISNGLPFTVGDCTKNSTPNTCNQTGYTCCISGGQAGMCVPPGQLCQGQTASAAYVWRFSTRDIPPVPHVVEQCNAASDLGKNLPSPTPNVQWDDSLVGDSHNVCKSALISIAFSTVMDQASVNASTVVVNKCIGVQSTDCNNATPVPLDPASFNLKLAQGGPQGNSNYLLITPPVIGWDNNTWYQVILKKGIQSVGAAGPVPLSVDRPCSDPDSAYCFVYRSDQRQCKLNAVIVTPTSYVTRVLEAPIFTHSSGQDGAVVYNSSGISDQHCILMDTKGYNWGWDTSNHTYATIFNEVQNATAQQISALGNTVAVGLPNNSVYVQATASTNTPQGLLTKTGASPLTIDLSNPQVVDYWPKCLEACTNAVVAVQFNVSMSNRNVLVGNPSAVQLLQCNDENCLSTTPVAASLTVGYDQKSGNTILNIANAGAVPDLSPNTLFEVLVSVSTTDLASPSLLWSAAFSDNFNSYSKPLTSQFAWRFRTKANKCSIDHVGVTPANYNAVSVLDRAVYKAQPYSSPDQCSSAGQALNAWSVAWSWGVTPVDNSIAKVQTFTTLGQNPACTNVCTLKGSTIASTAPTQAVCGSGGAPQAGQDCTTPNKNTGCGLDCRFLGNTDTNTCGNGVVERNLGEACDPKDPRTSVGCSSDCRHLGSKPVPDPQNPSASICGNGFVGQGEDCDLGIASNLSLASSSLYCTTNCLHIGTPISFKWCFDHAQDYGGFSVDDYKKACASAVSQCGDGIQSQDEDVGCDLGGGTHAAFCNDFCLYNNVSRQKCVPNAEGCDQNGQYLGSSLLYSVPSTCGTGPVAGIGEDPVCENNLSVSHAAVINPWALAIGVGKGVPSGNPPAQVAQISASTNQNTKGGTVGGNATFTIMCGYKTEADCQAIDPTYGLGNDTCCYPRPKLQGTYPTSSVPMAVDVCPNTSIEATFSGLIDPNTLKDNVIIATGQNANAPGGQKQLIHAAHINSPQPGIPNSFPARETVVGDKLYVTSWSNGGELQIYQINGPTLTFLGKLTASASANLYGAYGITVVGNYAYVTAYSNHGIVIVDISDPTRPRAVGQVVDPSMSSVEDVAIIGNYAFVASYNSNNVVAIDVTNKANPVIAASISNGQSGARLSGPDSIITDGTYLYTISWTGQFQILQFNTVTKTFSVLGSLINGQNVGGKVANMSTPGGLAKVGNYIYVGAHGSLGVQIIDVSDPNVPKPSSFLASTPTARMYGPLSVSVSGNYLYVGNYELQYGLAMFDITNPAVPVPLASIDRSSDTSGLPAFAVSNWVVASGNYAYVAGYSASGGIDVVDTHAFTAPDSSCTTDVTNLIARAPAEPWYMQWWQSLVALVHRVVGGSVVAKQNFIPNDWCSGAVAGTTEVVNDTSSTSRIIYHLAKPLDPDTTYAVILLDGLKDMHGVSIGKVQNRNINWKFNTAAKICEIATAQVVPSALNFNTVGATSTLEAKAFTAGGAQIQPLPGYYNWQYQWGPYDSASVSLGQTTSTRMLVTSLNHNGELDVRASATITANTISAASGIVATGKSHVIVYLCENPWPSKQASVTVNGVATLTSTFPYSDTANNRSGFANGSFNGSAIPPTPLGAAIVGDGYFNFSSYYCADNGAFGKVDDLPYLNPAVQVQNNVVSAATTLKRFIFTNTNNSDAIAIQVFDNPNHLSPRDWYSAGKADGGNGFVGALRDLQVDGYKAVRDDNNIYIDAVNYATNQQTIYSNIYLIGLSGNASADTRNVFDQLVKNLHFNVNLTNYGYCGQSVANPDFTQACKTDLDCAGGTTCSAQTDKLKRDYNRYTDFRVVDQLIAAYAANHNGTVPDLKEGTFLSGQAVSTWPTWSVLGAAIGASAPLDPINQLGPAGTCKTNPGRFCTTDSQCAPDTCVLHDPATGWSTADRRFSFACSTSSYAYRYQYLTPTTFSLRTHIEDMGSVIRNNQAFINGFGYKYGSSYVFAGDTNGICSQPQEITSLSQGTCGDGQVNLNLGERCDPPGGKVYDASACNANPTNGTVVVQTCGNTCQLGSPSTMRCSDYLSPMCGNGKIDPGESCDDGALNGRWNHCSKQCTPISTNPLGFCGDGLPEPQYKLCDTGTPGAIRYALKKTDSCNFDCQTYGPYCGDGVVSPQYGEQCDSAQNDLSCSVNNVSGNFICNNRCHYSDDALVWQKFDTGPAYTDDSTHQNDGVCVGAPCPSFMTTVGAVNGSGVFRGGAVSIADNASLIVTSSVTVEAWISPDNNTIYQAPGYERVLEKGGWNLGGGYALQFWGVTGKIMFAAFSSDLHTYYTVISNVAITGNNNIFTHVAATFTRNGQTQTIKIYVNGVDVSGEAHVYNNGVDTLLNSQSYSGPIQFLADSTGKNLVIGASGQANGYFFRGFVDDVRVYNYTLAPNQIYSQFSDHTGQVCHVPPAANSLAAGSCGDGKVDQNEACDNGAANGQVCTPSYNRTCSYCAGDCQNVVTVNPTQYCGNAVIEAAESCEFDAKGIYAKASNPITTQAVKATNNSNNDSNGYLVNVCTAEPVTPNAEQFKKGTKTCSNSCSAITINETGGSTCILCGQDAVNGVTVSGNILNVLEAPSGNGAPNSNPLYANSATDHSQGGSINLYNSAQAVGYARSNIRAIQGDGGVLWATTGASNQYTLEYYPNLDAMPTGDARVGDNPLCSVGPGSHYVMAINVDTPRAFDFTVKAKPDLWDNDLLLSPIMSSQSLMQYNGPDNDAAIANSATPNNVRIVVRWVRNSDFTSGLQGISSSGLIIKIEDTGLTPRYGAGTGGYFTQPPSAAPNWNGLWYHGFNSTPGQLDAEAYTIDTSRVGASGWKFYVRTSDLARGIKSLGSSSKLRVDVYFPETTGVMYYNLFSKPSQSYVLDLADVSANLNAPYWHVFDIQNATIPNVTQRVTPVVNNNVTYPNGRIITDLTQL